MATGSHLHDIRFAALAEALRQEVQTGPTEDTKSIRVRHGVYSLRGKSGQYIIRIRVPAGVVGAEQLETVAALSELSGWLEGAHLTTRQGIEIAGLPSTEIPWALERIEAVGLTTLRTGGPFVRGVVACPFSGVARDEIFDVTPYALAVDRHFREHAGFQQLPRKIKISFESCTPDHVRTRVSDIGLHAVRRDGVNGFRIVVGGGLGASPKTALGLEEFVPVEKVFAALEAVLRVFNRHGYRQNRARARLKWLLADWGIEKFREAVHAELKGASREWQPFGGSLPEFIEPGPATAPTVRKTTSISPDADFEAWRETNVRLQRQSGFASVLIRCPLGDLRPAQIRHIAGVARQFAGGIRTSIDQNLLLRWVPEGVLPELYQLLRSGALAAASAERLPDITRCVGATACLMAITNPRPAAEAIIGALDAQFATDPSLQELRIRISGCPNSCGHHHASDIGLFGVSKKFHDRPVPHYGLLLGGASSGEAFGGRVVKIPALNVAQAVGEVIGFYQAERQAAESFSAFVGRVGLPAFKQRLEPLTFVAAPAEQPAFYRDLGSLEAFVLGARGGECAA
ncbi:MAG: nitrite/sulfite reductase [Verrucomicrobiia bacterium]